MRLLRLHFHREAGKLIGIALLDKSRDAGGRWLLECGKLEATRSLAEVHLHLGVHGWEVGLEELPDAGAIAAVECFEPGRELTEGGACPSRGGFGFGELSELSGS